jgi:hypothetical protein
VGAGRARSGAKLDLGADARSGPPGDVRCAALYLGGLAAFRLRMLGQRSLGRVVTAVALLALYVVSGGFPAWSVGALIAALVGVLCALEAGAARTRAAPAREPETEVGPPSA